ncbi:MAG: 16S rRNA (adenine(1518)-N(6)/adenine(1519)-N(6))-dimethyltransferase RsmA [Dehalococcoidales bacterium]|nr:16S rRNA (adenine(1518)-N(6)/adenine(1519)-N(6))-dimethyltransferase RsmA [Dehalococcoidales bacterium]
MSNNNRRRDLLEQTQHYLRRLDLKARKKLGQHFLVDAEALAAVASAAELNPEDVVIEVGPGLGVLTGELVKQTGAVISVELDDRLAEILKKKMSAVGNFTVINRDILKVKPQELLSEPVAVNALKGKPLSYKVVANLPYYITSAVLRYFLEAVPQPSVIVVMVQKEVAEAIAAQQGKMSLLSASVQFYGNPEIVRIVPAASFYPPPEVDSAVLKIKIYEKPRLDIEDIDGFFNLVRAGFTASRKQLPNSLAQGLKCSKEDAVSLLEEAEIDPKRRAETLSLEEWGRLWKIYGRLDNVNG